ncbi:hypothetical protein SLEP1_g60379 [Rubroshorea leprosula]|uniref:Gnk2-homologous domain-containing protein n=1 Tax=Rubroshorea leprosula TaxID=152421 RepID=A0AAV5MYV5_9ROSI|nr:hypothetical protein SLEP1_g60379 [Rubroshorea leprosula]
MNVSSAQIADDFRKSCASIGNFTANSAYDANLNRLFFQLSSNQDFNNGFYNMSVGQSPDKVNAIALCRGDKNVSVCISCLKNNTYALRQTCPKNKEAIGWSEFCTLRYSNRQIYGIMEIDPTAELWRTGDSSTPSDADVFYQTLSFLLKNLSTRAAAGGPNFKWATGMTVTPEKIFAIVQCTPDLSQQNCSACLEKAMADEKMRTYCYNKTGCRILQPSCNLRYEIGQFFDGEYVTVDVPSSPPPPEGNENNPNQKSGVAAEGSNATRTIIISVVASVIASLVGNLSLILCI